jgi:hypothetical protein
VPNETEQLLERLFAELPEADAESGERALARALERLPARGRRRRPGRGLAILVAAAVGLLALAAGALAAAGALHVSFGRLSPHGARTRSRATAPQLLLPRGAAAVAAVVGGRLWLTTGGGLHLQGLPVSAAALSPHARYVAAGIGDALVALAPDGRRAWSRPAGGTVVAIAWAPDGLRIAYVVRDREGLALHLIEGDGGHDTAIDPAVRAVRPSWRADSLGVAYVGAGGRPVIYDLGHRSRRVVGSPAARDATRLAFAPSGAALALATRHGFLVAGAGARPSGAAFAPSLVAGLGWLDGRVAVAIDPAHAGDQGPFVELFRLDRGEAVPAGRLIPPAAIDALDADGDRLALALVPGPGARILVAIPAATAATVPLGPSQVVLGRLAAGVRVSAVAVR